MGVVGFRVVNEIHSSATRKNKEWQDKLPIVVLKAEEIMYSKATSEVEIISTFYSLCEKEFRALLVWFHVFTKNLSKTHFCMFFFINFCVLILGRVYGS